jgi:AraC-like DNA-binding protein
MLKTLVALDGVEVFRPAEFAGEVELQTGEPAMRSWPTRLCEGFEITLLIGPTHPATIQGRPTETPGKTTFVQMPGTVWSAPEALGALLSMEITPALFERLVHQWPKRSSLPGPSQIVVPWLIDFFWSAHEVMRSSCDAMMRSETLVRLVGTTLTLLTGSQAEAPSSSDGVSKVRDAIHDRPAHAPSIDELAALAGLTVFELVRAFRQRYGVTPSRYRQALRVARARRLLAGGRRIDEVATELGFASASALGRVFATHVGLTPERYATLP